jgi:hypothetical protein
VSDRLADTLGSEPTPLRIIKGIRPAGGRKSGAEATRAKNLWAALPGLWVLAKPHRGLLAVSLVLIAIGRAAGLALPGSTLLPPVGAVAFRACRPTARNDTKGTFTPLVVFRAVQ